MGRGYPNPSGMGMGFTFSSPLGMGRVTGKYMRIGYGDGECKTRHHPAPLPCLQTIEMQNSRVSSSWPDRLTTHQPF